MGSRSRADDDGRRRAGEIRTRIGVELRLGRGVAGISQGTAGNAAGMSRSQYGRIERAEVVGLTIEQACRAAEAVGLHLGARVFPGDDPARDARHLKLRERLRGLIPVGAVYRTEVVLRIRGDRRAWDATIDHLGRRAGCEIENVIADVQALERKLAAKVRDGEVDVLILVVADTGANRAVLRRHREELRSLLPLDTREILGCFRRGRLPGASGILVL